MNLRDRERGEHLRNSYNVIRQTKKVFPLNMIPWRSETCYGVTTYIEQEKLLGTFVVGEKKTSTRKISETPVSGLER